MPDHCRSCASEVVKKMGGTEEEVAMVSGWAGGIGLTDNACGALGAAIWMKTLALCKKQPGKSFFSSAEAHQILNKFYQTTNYEIICSEVSGQKFNCVEEHTEYLDNGGCEKLIKTLAKS